MDCFFSSLLTMTLRWILLLLAFVRFTNAQIKHIDIELDGCTATVKESLMQNDGDELWHADFKKQQVVVTMPVFADPIDWTGVYQPSVLAQMRCKQDRELAIDVYGNPPEAVDAPQSSIYTKVDVQLGSKNTLICHVTGFFPPPVSVSWRKNNVDVTDMAVLSQFYPKQDGTYHQFSHLSFTAVEGDVYTCTVQHKSLESPQTRTWEVTEGDFEEARVSIVPPVVCGVGVSVGLLTAATGTFFLIKGSKCK